jgi:hypothetical protein
MGVFRRKIMSHQTLAEHCAASLAGLKTGSLFTVKVETEELIDSLREWNQLFKPFGIRVIPLRYGKGSALIYLYRDARLAQDLNHPCARHILKDRGYCLEGGCTLVAQLKDRIREKADFPHEIGLFLGYPPEDVEGFLKDSNKGVKCVGCWKVYGDATKAQRTFQKFHDCREYFSRQLLQGRPLQQLIVGN